MATRYAKTRVVYSKPGIIVEATPRIRIASLSMSGYKIYIRQNRVSFSYTVNNENKTKPEVETLMKSLMSNHRLSVALRGKEGEMRIVESLLDTYRGLEVFNGYLSKM